MLNKINFSLSVVVPVKNEEENVTKLIEEIFSSVRLSEHDFDVIFIDDKSDDNTLGVLTELKSKYPELRVLAHENNCGQSRAVYTGVLYSEKDYIVVLDGDGQNNPKDILQLVKLMEENANLGMVIGHRIKRQDDASRKISSILANKIRSSLLKDNAPDSGCGLKILKREIFLRLPFFDHMHRFMVALVKREGHEVISIPIDHRERMHGKSKYGFWGRLYEGFTDLLGVCWLISRMKNTHTREV